MAETVGSHLASLEPMTTNEPSLINRHTRYSIVPKFKLFANKEMERYTDDSKCLLQLLVHIFTAIEGVRMQRKSPSREVIPKVVSENMA